MSRLIDGDALIEAINKSTCNFAEHLCKRVVCDVIENQPIAYDTEKVVAELKEESIESEGFFMNYTEEAIDIVKRGGIE